MGGHFRPWITSQYASSLAGMGRRLSRRWSRAKRGAGGGYIHAVWGGPLNGVHGIQWQGSGNIAYRRGGHVMVASAQRSVADYYGAGRGRHADRSSAGWSWRPPGRAGPYRLESEKASCSATDRRRSAWAMTASGPTREFIGACLTARRWGCNMPSPPIRGPFPVPGTSGAGSILTLHPAFAAFEHRVGHGSTAAGQAVPVADKQRP